MRRSLQIGGSSRITRSGDKPPPGWRRCRSAARSERMPRRLRQIGHQPLP
jgi:hypothetical protein